MASIFPGLHPNADLSTLSVREAEVVRRFATEQYVTHVGRPVEMGNQTKYRYFLFKPVDHFAEMFTLDREIRVLFSSYDSFEPRTLDALDEIRNRHEQFRIEPVCSVLVSADQQIEHKIRQLLSNNPETQVIVPMTYSEAQGFGDPYFLRNKFIEHLFSRDLFSFSGPLKKDTFFYGRSEIINRLVGRHRSGESAGLFGLRRTGKTSVAFGVMRQLKNQGEPVVFIDCQSPAFNQKRWYSALRYVITEAVQQTAKPMAKTIVPKFTSEQAGEQFEQWISLLSGRLDRRILVVFDEIENMTFGVSPVEHWDTGTDFIFFWQTLRSVFQKRNCFTFLIVGTNPTCVETATIDGKDNPIFNQIPFEYIPGFTVQQTREMVRKLGRLMGLKYDELIYSRLTEDFGGHPFLIRQVNSLLHRRMPKQRPVIVDRRSYDDARVAFGADSGQYIEMILNILLDYYPDEYEMLRVLALDDQEYFRELAGNSPHYTKHLIGYGIVEHVNGNFLFRIEIVSDYLRKRERTNATLSSNAERLSEVSRRRNELEPKLRRIVRQALMSTFGERSAYERMLSVMTPGDAAKVKAMSYKEIFDPRRSPIYLRYVADVIERNWGAFQHVFAGEKSEIVARLRKINAYRADAHAAIISNAEYADFCACADRIQEDADDFLLM